jgi:hypothetical protein
MGAAGRERARAVFDWSGVFAQYQALWGELNARRLAVTDDPQLLARVTAAPRAAPTGNDPFRTFSHYPTGLIAGETRVRLAAGASMERLREVGPHGLFSGSFATPAHGLALWEALAAGEVTLAELAAAALVPLPAAQTAIATLAKMGLAVLDPRT